MEATGSSDGTDRRRFLVGTAAGAAAAWVAPTILSIDAASAATQPDSVLYAISGEGGGSPQSLWTVNPATGAATFVLSFGAVSPGNTDGEAIGVIGTNIYRLSGRGTKVLDVVAVPGFAITPIAPSGATYDEGGALTANGASFYMAESFNAVPVANLYTMTTAGVVALIGAIDHKCKGLALDGIGTLYSVDQNSANLRTLNTATGATLTSIGMTSTFGTIAGANGLAIEPTTGVFTVLLRFGAGPSVRRLATLNPITGVTTDIGPVDNGSGTIQMAGLAWM